MHEWLDKTLISSIINSKAIAFARKVPMHTEIYTSFSNNALITFHIFLCVLYIRIAVNQHINQGRQKFMSASNFKTNMATL